MGIDFSHTDAHWSYSGFSRFRRALAAHEGIDLDRMEGFRPFSVPPQEWTGMPWTEVTTPLKPLLDHSDCDGELTPEECRQVAPRLREVVKAIWKDPDAYDRRMGLLLAEAMEAAAEANEPLEFQ